jgi:DNA-3-methyladenine glycosylase II
LRAVGLSQSKALSVLDLARKSTDGTLASLRRIGRMSDAEVIDNLCQVRGIGLWTAQMVLIFNLGRPDVMPATDLGVQKGVQAVYGIKCLPDPDTVLRRTRHLAPFRSAASWYFWRAAETRLIT